ncbi:DNA/RNA non-specific endonuclease [Bombilactobacillus bombi]|uniref:DNA/RNA non-specific endonuclease n=1 Tax=Bombilactobacillus bombi TaxID=1303590 RepID=UPI0015E5F14C|nr:DNA/RNA non-specific endonuclease [Bombilactobacillus bombi]MBA1434000.1 endonuclease [Bombilactobacillus bombi]
MAKRKASNKTSSSYWVWLILLVALSLLGGGKIGGVNRLLHNPSQISPSSLLQNNQVKLNSSDNQELIKLQFDPHKYPQNYAIINNNQPEFSSAAKKRLQIMRSGNNLQVYLKQSEDQQDTLYNNLDSLGRTQAVTSFVRYRDVLKHSGRVMKRPPFPATTRISGEYVDGTYDADQQQWYGHQSNNRIVNLNNYRGYLYNKSHLLAWSLGGTMMTNNVVLGTRAQNVGTNSQSNPGGMAYSETRVRNFLKTHQQEVIFYQAIPVYYGNELVPRGVHVLAQAVHNPQALQINVWTFNTQAGVKINYQTGQAALN